MTDEFFKNFINKLVDASGEYIRGEFGKAHDVEKKKDSSPVTIVDKTTEEILRTMIKKEFPDAGIIGEEFGNENTNAEYVWVLDPIDGTKSFISSIPLFGTLIGLMKRGEYFMGAIDQPILKERCLGDNHTCLFNGKRILANSTQKELKGATALISDTREVRWSNRNMDSWRELEDKLAILRTWGDCYGYMMLCRAQAHLMLDPVLEIWDLAALIPCVRGAGAFVSDWHGGSNFGKDGLIAACTQEILAETLTHTSR